MSYWKSIVGLGVAVMLLPTYAKASTLIPSEDTEAQSSVLMSQEPLSAMFLEAKLAEATTSLATDLGQLDSESTALENTVIAPTQRLLAQANTASETNIPGSLNPTWRFSFEPFASVPLRTTGNLRAGNINVPINVGLSQILDPLNFAFSGKFEAWYENQGIIFNAGYFSTGISDTRDFTLPPALQGVLPGSLAVDASANLLKIDLLYAYRFSGEPENGYSRGFTEFDLPPLSFDLMGGLRFYSLAQEVVLTNALGNSLSRSSSSTIIAPIIRGRLRWNTSDYLALKLDTSFSGFGFGDATPFSWSSLAALEWLFSGNTSINIGYQINYVDISTDSGSAALNLTGHGPYLGMIFRF